MFYIIYCSCFSVKLQLQAESIGVVSIKGISANRYLAMNEDGRLFGTVSIKTSSKKLGGTAPTEAYVWIWSREMGSGHFSKSDVKAFLVKYFKNHLHKLYPYPNPALSLNDTSVKKNKRDSEFCRKHYPLPTPSYAHE